MKNHFKKSISLFLAVVMLLCAVPVGGLSDIFAKVAAVDGRVENAVQTAVAIANDNSHGYSQKNRQGPDYDCSSLVYYAFSSAGFSLSPAWFNTATMGSALRNAGFTELSDVNFSSSASLQRGDILWKTGHTEIYIGDNQLVGAHSDYGYPQSGDQNGKEISVTNYYKTGNNGTSWTKVYRYTAGTINNPPIAPKNLRTANGMTLFTSNDYITFYWDASLSATDYWIYMWKDGVQIYSTYMGNNTSFTSAPTSAGKYTLIVRAGNNYGYSNDSAAIDFTVYSEPPAAPKNLRTSTSFTSFLSSDYITFNWDPSFSATNYRVYMFKNGEELYSTDMEGNTSFTSAPTSPGKYTLMVKAGNSFGYSNDYAVIDFMVYDKNTSHSVTFDPNGGSCSPSSKTVTYGSAYGTLPTPTRTGYTFDGWYTAASDGTKVTSETKVTATGNHTLYAHWSQIQPESPDEPIENCSCACHKTGIVKIVYLIMRILWKMFKTNQYCSCGAKHY